MHDVTQAAGLLHGEEQNAFGDAGYQSVAQRAEVQAKHAEITWHVAVRLGKRRALDKQTATGKIMDRLEQLKAGLEVEHRQFIPKNRRFEAT